MADTTRFVYYCAGNQCTAELFSKTIRKFLLLFSQKVPETFWNFFIILEILSNIQKLTQITLTQREWKKVELIVYQWSFVYIFTVKQGKVFTLCSHSSGITARLLLENLVFIMSSTRITATIFQLCPSGTNIDLFLSLSCFLSGSSSSLIGLELA